ncbi:MAG: hypothetical protein NXI32_17890 [bacterium]|nr:hypothetical protein [bacterium]
MIDPGESDTLEKLAELIAERVAERLSERQDRVLVGRKELAQITGLGVRTIDRMAAGGSMEKGSDGRHHWRESEIKLEPIRNGRTVLFDKEQALRAIKSGGRA